MLFTGATSSACGFAQSAMGPFYCPNDQTVYLDMDFFRVMEQQLGSRGEFARAYVIAHEVGHHVQDELGVLAQVNAQRAAVGRARSRTRSRSGSSCRPTATPASGPTPRATRFSADRRRHPERARHRRADRRRRAAAGEPGAGGARQLHPRDERAAPGAGSTAATESGDPDQCDTFSASGSEGPDGGGREPAHGPQAAPPRRGPRRRPTEAAARSGEARRRTCGCAAPRRRWSAAASTATARAEGRRERRAVSGGRTAGEALADPARAPHLGLARARVLAGLPGHRRARGPAAQRPRRRDRRRPRRRAGPRLGDPRLRAGAVRRRRLTMMSRRRCGPVAAA